MNPETESVLFYFYPDDTPLRRLLLEHSRQVSGKAMEIRNSPACRSMRLNSELVQNGAMLHDLGIGKCHAPGILCEGTEPYLLHGVIGARMLREFGDARGLDLELYARICERHTGSGITGAEIREQNLPLPVRDYLPETPEEKLICLADKFFSKSGDRKEKSMDRVVRSMRKFGPEPFARFLRLCETFGVDCPRQLYMEYT